MKTTDISGTEDAEEERKKRKKVCVEDDVVSVYFQGVRKFELLTAEEEKELSRKMRKGDEQARETFINANLRLVISIAKMYHGKVVHLKMSDLIHAGNEGLIKAVDRFNPDHGGRFSTYATHWIRQAVRREVERYEQAIRNPTHVMEALQRYNKAVRHLTHQLGRAPTVSEIAVEMKQSEEWIRKKTKTFRKYVSLDEPVMSGGKTLGDFIVGSDETDVETSVFRSEYREKFAEIFGKSPLTNMQREVLRLRYGFDGDGERLTLRKIGARFGLSGECIRQIEADAMKKITKYVKYGKYRKYFEEF